MRTIKLKDKIPIPYKFWITTNRGDNKKTEIDVSELISFFHKKCGAVLYQPDPRKKTTVLISVKEGIVDHLTTVDLKQQTQNYLISLPNQIEGTKTAQVLKSIHSGTKHYFSQGMIEFVPRVQVDFLRDDENTAFFTFENGIVKVTSTNVERIQYSSLPSQVWKSEIIPFRINILNPGLEPPNGDFTKFVRLIAGNEKGRFESFVSTIGYLLHKHKDPVRPYAVILAEEVADENNGGGSGKGILVTALSKLVNTVKIDGKNFKLGKNFAFQRVDLDTRLICIEDVRQNVDFEGFYSIITEGVTVEKKGRDELFIPYVTSPKIIFTTNYSIRAEAGHAVRRQKVLPFTSYFNVNHTPEEEFRKLLFEGWDETEWNHFYNFLFYCVRYYIQHGIVDVSLSDVFRYKNLRLTVNNEFAEWWEKYTANGCGEWKDSRELYQEFLLFSDQSDRDCSKKAFSQFMKKGAQIWKTELSTRRNGESKTVQYKLGHDVHDKSQKKFDKG